MDALTSDAARVASGEQASTSSSLSFRLADQVRSDNLTRRRSQCVDEAVDLAKA